MIAARPYRSGRSPDWIKVKNSGCAGRDQAARGMKFGARHGISAILAEAQAHHDRGGQRNSGKEGNRSNQRVARGPNHAHQKTVHEHGGHETEEAVFNDPIVLLVV
jgi:hypothetical protein